MAPIIVTLWQWRKAILWLSIVAAVALAGWRVTAWWEAYQALPAVEKELAAELSCEAGSACERRTLAAAREAEERAAEKASGALAGAVAREEQAQRDAAEWRRKYRAAVQDDPDCAAWSAGAVKCPL